MIRRRPSANRRTPGRASLPVHHAGRPPGKGREDGVPPLAPHARRAATGETALASTKRLALPHGNLRHRMSDERVD